MTTITAPRRLAAPVSSRPARRGLLLGFGAAFILGIVLVAATSLAIGAAAAGTVLPGVSVGGVELGGLSREEAFARLAAELPSVSTGTATITVDGQAEVVPFEDLGRRYDTDAMVEAALGVGRADDPLADGIARLRTLVRAQSLPIVVHAYDPDALERAAAAIAERHTIEPVDATVSADGAFTVTASADGRVLDAETVAAALGERLDTTSPADVAVDLAPTVVPAAIDTATAEAAADAARRTARALTLEVPGAAQDEQAPTLSADVIAGWLSFAPREDGTGLEVVVDEAAAGDAVAALAESIESAAVDAQIGVAPGGGLGGVVPGTPGRELQVVESRQALLDALGRRAAGASVGSLALVVDVTEPTFATAAAEALLPRMEMISSWTTYFDPGEGNGWGKNITIGAYDIDGRNLYPGEWFSFWDSIGPVTEERGYTYGGAIINGRSTQGVAIGGGICSTSTTIFNAALRAGLEMGERLNHYYYIDRYPDGLDATVSIMDGWTQDITFRNDTDNPIVIRGFGGTDSVTFQIWSVPLDRRVVITDPVVSNVRQAVDTTVVDASMAPGTSRRVEYPNDGHDVSRTRYVYDAVGNLIHENYYFSSYATVNGIVAVGR